MIEDPTPQAQEGGLGSSTGVLHAHGWGYTHTVSSFSLIFGGGEDRGRGWDTNPSKCLVNKDIAPLTETSYDCLSSSTLPAEHGPHCLPYCNTTNSHAFTPRVRPSCLKTQRDSGWFSQDKPFSVILLREHGSIGVVAAHRCMII